MKLLPLTLILTLTSFPALAVPRNAGLHREASFISQSTLDAPKPISYIEAKKLLYFGSQEASNFLESGYKTCDFYETNNLTFREIIQIYQNEGNHRFADILIVTNYYLCPQIP